VVVRDRDECEYFGGAPISHNPGRANLQPNLLAGMALPGTLLCRNEKRFSTSRSWKFEERQCGGK
jgi:hypothetical protein